MYLFDTFSNSRKLIFSKFDTWWQKKNKKVEINYDYIFGIDFRFLGYGSIWYCNCGLFFGLECRLNKKSLEDIIKEGKFGKGLEYSRFLYKIWKKISQARRIYNLVYIVLKLMIALRPTWLSNILSSYWYGTILNCDNILIPLVSGHFKYLLQSQSIEVISTSLV